MSLGAEAAGVRVKVAVESDPHAAATFCLNHPQTLVHNSSDPAGTQSGARGTGRRTARCFWRPSLPRVLDIESANT